MDNIFYTIIILLLCFSGLAIKVFFRKGTLSGSCSSININDDGECSVCGKKNKEVNCLK